MGRGDKKSKKGKISMGSFGVSRKKKTHKKVVTPVAKEKVQVETVEVKAAPKKRARKKTES